MVSTARGHSEKEGIAINAKMDRVTRTRIGWGSRPQSDSFGDGVTQTLSLSNFKIRTQRISETDAVGKRNQKQTVHQK